MVISMSILRHEERSSDLREAYLKQAAERRRENGEEGENGNELTAEPDGGELETVGAGTPEEIVYSEILTEERFAEMAEREQFVLSVTEKGFGVRSSAYGYRITGRSGQGINNMDLTRRQDAVVAVFPVGHNDQIMLVTDGGMVIRCPVHDIRIVRRGGAGVVIFKLGDGERVVSVARLPEVAEENGAEENGGDTEEPPDDFAGPAPDGPASK
jgi:DNA gyrase subunit A